MFKTVALLMFCWIALAILHVESRNVYGIREGSPAPRFQFFRIGKDPIHSDSSNEDDGNGYIHAKRKSELLSSLYSLPYSLVNQRNAD